MQRGQLGACGSVLDGADGISSRCCHEIVEEALSEGVGAGKWKGVTVAVKIVEHSAETEGELLQLRESLLSSSIVHPNVVSLSDPLKAYHMSDFGLGILCWCGSKGPHGWLPAIGIAFNRHVAALPAFCCCLLYCHLQCVMKQEGPCTPHDHAPCPRL